MSLLELFQARSHRSRLEKEPDYMLDFNFNESVQRFLEGNQRFVDSMYQLYERYPEEVILGLVPKGNLVISLWKDENGETQSTGFMANLSLVCADSAFENATAFESNSDYYFTFHTNRGYNRLKRMLKKENAKYAKRFTRTDGTLDMISLRGDNSDPKFSFKPEGMSGVNYLALLAQRKMTGLEIHTIQSFPQPSTSVYRRGSK